MSGKKAFRNWFLWHPRQIAFLNNVSSVLQTASSDSDHHHLLPSSAISSYQFLFELVHQHVEEHCHCEHHVNAYLCDSKGFGRTKDKGVRPCPISYQDKDNRLTQPPEMTSAMKVMSPLFVASLSRTKSLTVNLIAFSGQTPTN